MSTQREERIYSNKVVLRGLWKAFEPLVFFCTDCIGYLFTLWFYIVAVALFGWVLSVLMPGLFKFGNCGFWCYIPSGIFGLFLSSILWGIMCLVRYMVSNVMDYIKQHIDEEARKEVKRVNKNNRETKMA
jgi:type III secretory pathway component EscU